MDLAQLLQEQESKTLEFKRDLSSPDKIMRTVVAFANGAGGTVLIWCGGSVAPCHWCAESDPR
jgi:predicted HTH transcriptional regulator